MLCRMSSPEQPQPGPRQPQHPRADREGADQGGSAPTSSATSQYGLSPQPQSDQPTPSTPAGQYGHVPATQPAQPGGATEYGRTAPGTQAAAQAATQAEHPDSNRGPILFDRGISSELLIFNFEEILSLRRKRRSSRDENLESAIVHTQPKRNVMLKLEQSRSDTT